MIHLNGNILCAIDVETTGAVPGHHDLIQICVMPLNTKLEPNQEITPFYADIKPKRPDNWDEKASSVHKKELTSIMINGLDPWHAVDLFDEWFRKLPMGLFKRIMPLAHNWPFDRAFICDWLGHVAFDQMFDARYRDTMVAALVENDLADFKAAQVPYAKVNLPYLASTMKIEHHSKLHDALIDCQTVS